MTESVCVIFSECIFADNIFWSFSMFFTKKRDQWYLFLDLFSDYDIFLSALFQDFTLYLLFLLFLWHIQYGVTVSGEGSICGWKNRALREQDPVYDKTQAKACLKKAARNRPAAMIITDYFYRCYIFGKAFVGYRPPFFHLETTEWCDRPAFRCRHIPFRCRFSRNKAVWK